MLNFYKGGAAYILLFVLAAMFSITVLNGCDDSGVVDSNNNPNVMTYDSVGVEEDSTGASRFSAIDLFNGISLVTGSNASDMYLARDSNGVNFHLHSGAYETKIYRSSAGMSASDFDTITAVFGINPPLDSSDFTHWATDSWGYFTAPMSISGSHPVYCFWLKGRKDAHQNHDVNIFGIIQPREASDAHPGQGGFRMSFRIRINITGENDFRKTLN